MNKEELKKYSNKIKWTIEKSEDGESIISSVKLPKGLSISQRESQYYGWITKLNQKFISARGYVFSYNSNGVSGRRKIPIKQFNKQKERELLREMIITEKEYRKLEKQIENWRKESINYQELKI